jgi:uncharacterized protein YjbI with pentapeptide repeats
MESAYTPITIAALGDRLYRGDRDFINLRLEGGKDLSAYPRYRELIEMLAELNAHNHPLFFAYADMSGLIAPDINLASMRASHVVWEGAQLIGAQLEKTVWEYADLSGANLTRTMLEEAIFNGEAAKGEGRDGINLEGASLWLADLRGAHLNYVNLKWAKLLGATLDDTVLSHSDLSYANLATASLARARLSHTNLFGTNLEQASIIDADFTYVDLRGVKGIRTAEGLETASFTPPIMDIATWEAIQAVRAEAERKKRLSFEGFL